MEFDLVKMYEVNPNVFVFELTLKYNHEHYDIEIIKHEDPIWTDESGYELDHSINFVNFDENRKFINYWHHLANREETPDILAAAVDYLQNECKQTRLLYITGAL
jgi:hypothetical protein